MRKREFENAFGSAAFYLSAGLPVVTGAGIGAGYLLYGICSFKPAYAAEGLGRIVAAPVAGALAAIGFGHALLKLNDHLIN